MAKGVIEKLNFAGIQTDDISVEQQKLDSDSSSKEGSRGKEKREDYNAKQEYLESLKNPSFSNLETK